MSFLSDIKDAYEDFIYRRRNPIVSPIAEKELVKSDEELAWCAEERISRALEIAKGSYGSKIDRLPQCWRMIDTLISLDRDVNNGGFHQFFTNAGGRYDAYLMDDVQFLGHSKLSGLLERVWMQYSKIDYTDQWENRGKSWEFFTEGYKDGRWDEESMFYYREVVERDSIMPILGAFIRAHQHHYFGTVTET